jgi:hypothetical protein
MTLEIIWEKVFQPLQEQLLYTFAEKNTAGKVNYEVYFF